MSKPADSGVLLHQPGQALAVAGHRADESHQMALHDIVLHGEQPATKKKGHIIVTAMFHTS